MNLLDFLKQTDLEMKNLSREQLEEFIHETARLLPEKDRGKFLEKLRTTGKESNKELELKPDASFQKQYELVKSTLDRVESRQLTLENILNEEYDDWYDNGDEFFYRDKEHIGEAFREGCLFVHACMEREQYQTGFEIGRRLFTAKIFCRSEYKEENLSIDDLKDLGFLHYSLDLAALDTSFCAYQSSPLAKRAPILYDLLTVLPRELTLEAIAQHGKKELTDIQEFLPLWISYLSEKSGEPADRLFLEAANLIREKHTAARYAKECASIHPALYLSLLEKESFTDTAAAASLGMEALSVIPKNYTIRSKAALQTADCLLLADRTSSLTESCYFAACESDPNVPNYLRALLHGYDTKEKRMELRALIPPLPEPDRYGSYHVVGTIVHPGERQEANPNAYQILTLKFFDGQFFEVLEKGLCPPGPLGWLATFLDQGIALFLLYIHEGRPHSPGMADMLRLVIQNTGFSKEEYLKGTGESSAEDETSFFCSLFARWKSVTPMDPDLKGRVIEKITKELENHTEEIMAGNHRSRYGECASYLAALGETLESLGNPNAKHTLFSLYSQKYSRRSAFHKELSKYA